MRISRYDAPGFLRGAAPITTAEPAPTPVAGAVGILGSDGFTYYTCTGECGETKIAALFLPSEIAKQEPVCRACLGEVTIRSRRSRDPKTATRAAYKNLLDRRASAQ
jgi:hypothetical protein